MGSVSRRSTSSSGRMTVNRRRPGLSAINAIAGFTRSADFSTKGETMLVSAISAQTAYAKVRSLPHHSLPSADTHAKLFPMSKRILT